jgi:uncharacterized protein involved in oxidation of intracellular sulfur
MKHFPAILMVLAALLPLCAAAQQPDAMEGEHQPTTLGIIVSTNDEETVWNVFRLANYSLNAGDTVTVFLLGKGVEVDQLLSTSSRMKEQVESFRENDGRILACGTCLQDRNNPNPTQCSVSTMSELYAIVRNNRIVLSF